MVGAIVLTACTADGPAPAPPEAAPITSATTAGPSPAAPGSAAPVPTSAWIANEVGRTLSQVDVTGERVMAQHQTPGRPHNLAVGSGGVVAATLPGEGLLYLLDPAAGGKAVDLGGKPHDVKPAGTRFVVANEGAAALQTLERDGSPVGNIAFRRSRTTSPSRPTSAPPGSPSTEAIGSLSSIWNGPKYGWCRPGPAPTICSSAPPASCG